MFFFSPNCQFPPLVDVLHILVGLPSSSSLFFFCRCALFFVLFKAYGYLTFVFRFLFACCGGLLLFVAAIFVSLFFLQFVVLVDIFARPRFAV